MEIQKRLCADTQFYFLGICHLDNSSETDLEGVADPFLCHYLGTSGTLYLKGSTYSSDTFEAYSTSKLVGGSFIPYSIFIKMNLYKLNFSFPLGCNPDQRIAGLGPYESGYLKKKECCQYSPPQEDPFDQCVGIIGTQATNSRLMNSINTQNEGTVLKSRNLNSDAFDLNRSLEPSSITSKSTFMGMF